MASKHLAVLLIGVCLCNLSIQSPSSSFYSLQPAVEALSEREAQLALRNEIENGNIDDFIDSDDFEWNNNDYENLEREQQPLLLPNKARFLSRYNPDYEEFYPDYRKRAILRKRDSSVFRERSRAPNIQIQEQQKQALAEKFLRAIENEREKEEEEERRQHLRNLWNHYQVEESDMERDLFDNEPGTDIDWNVDFRKKKRQNVGDAEVAPPYWNNKRSMPMLPWLPASRKKRFPVTKRSPKMNAELVVASEGNDKVSHDLQGIFGKKDNGKNSDSSMKKKRSSEETHPLVVDNEKKNENLHEAAGHGNMCMHCSHNKQKRDAEPSDDEEETDNDNENDEEADKETDDTDDGAEEDDSSEDDSKKKKKKREAPKDKVRNDNSPAKKRSKKSVQWSSIFGLDRKKKSSGLIFHPLEEVDRRKKRCGPGEQCDSLDYGEEDYDSDDDDYRRKKKKKRSTGEEKLDAMDRKLKTIENLIIDETVNYYENHDGSISPSKARALKNLERMRSAIARLKQSMEYEKYLERNLLNSPQSELDEDEEKKKAKRVAVKKEKAEFDNNDHDIESPAKKAVADSKKNDLHEEDENKKKKKRSQKKSELNHNFISDEPPMMSEGYMGGSRNSNECPILDGIEKKCRGIDIMSGDAQQNLLNACGTHQLCYLCGDSQMQCDYDYLSDAEEICDRDLKCKIAARQALTVLRELGGSSIGPRECIRNPCLNMALRSIAY